MIRIYVKIKNSFFAILQKISPDLFEVFYRYRIYVKYIFAGGTAATVDLALLAFGKEFLNLHYLVAATGAFAIAFFVSFILQKVWTFGNTSIRGLRRQIFGYLGIAVSNLLVNILLMYVFVDLFHIWYFLAQIMSGGIIAFVSFILYRRLVFKKNERKDI